MDETKKRGILKKAVTGLAAPGKKVISGLSGALSRDAVAAHAGRASDYDAMRRRSTADRLKNQFPQRTIPKTMPLRTIPDQLRKSPKSPKSPLKDRIRERRDFSDKRPKNPLRDQSPLRDRMPRFL